MARQTGTLLSGTDGYAQLSYAPTVDLRQTGQNGFIPDYRTYLSNSAYVQRPVICFLLEYPRGFDYLPNPEIYIGTLKQLVETQAKSIDGLNGTVSVEYIDNPVGASGEVQHDYSATKRAPSNPVFVWVERQGTPIKLFFDAWIFNLLGHPDTQTPMINSYAQGGTGANNGTLYFDFLPDFNSCSMLFVEPDPFQRRVVEAWLCVNMMPKGSGDISGKREIGASMQSREVQVEFTCMQMMTNGVKQFGQRLLDQLNYVGLNPHNRRSAIEYVNTKVAEAGNVSVGWSPTDKNDNVQIGYAGQVNDIATTNNFTNSPLDGATKHNPSWVLSNGEN